MVSNFCLMNISELREEGECLPNIILNGETFLFGVHLTLRRAKVGDWCNFQAFQGHFSKVPFRILFILSIVLSFVAFRNKI